VLVTAGILVFIPALGTAFVSAPEGAIEFCDELFWAGVLPVPFESELCEQPVREPAVAVNKPKHTAKLIILV
jgi:hypothetical protein